MVKASRGILSRRTRKLRGKSYATPAKIIRTFNLGDAVIISPRAKHEGLPHLRYSGKHGYIIEKRGKSYVVEVNDYARKKEVIVGPIHLRKVIS